MPESPELSNVENKKVQVQGLPLPPPPSQRPAWMEKTIEETSRYIVSSDVSAEGVHTNLLAGPELTLDDKIQIEEISFACKGETLTARQFWERLMGDTYLNKAKIKLIKSHLRNLPNVEIRRGQDGNNRYHFR